MKQRVPVSQIMSKDIITIAPTQTLYEAEALFKKHNIRHIPVVEGHKLIGVLSLTDLLRISFAALSEDEKHYKRSSRNISRADIPLITCY